MQACHLRHLVWLPSLVWSWWKKDFHGGGGNRVVYDHLTQVQLSKSYLHGVVLIWRLYLSLREEILRKSGSLLQCKDKAPCCIYKTWRWYISKFQDFPKPCSVVMFLLFLQIEVQKSSSKVLGSSFTLGLSFPCLSLMFFSFLKYYIVFHFSFFPYQPLLAF